MLKYIVKRLAYAVLILVGVSLIIYFLIRLMPVDFIQDKINAINQGGATVSEETVQAMYEMYGLGDDSFSGILKGYFTWLAALAKFDLGTSFVHGIPVAQVIVEHMGISFAIALIATVFEFMIAIPLGITAATHQYSIRDYVVTVLVMIGISLPSFFFGQVLKDLLANEYELAFELADPEAFRAALTDRKLNATGKKNALRKASGYTKADVQQWAVCDLLAGGTVKPSALLNREFSKEDDKNPFQFRSDLGFGFKLRDPDALTYDTTLPFMVIANRNRMESLSEELRLLYVALTRAREYLILPIVYSANYVKQKAQGYLCEQIAFCGQTDLLTASADSMRDWLLMALLRNPGCAHLRKCMELSDYDADDRMLPLSVITELEEPVSEPQASDEAETDAADAKTETETDPSLLDCLSEQCAWEYDSPLMNLPAKYGVSEIAHGEEFSAPLRRPLFVRERHGLSGAERGTALHTFLQYADFKAAKADPEQEVERLTTEGRLTKRQAKAVRTSAISEFFTSDLYERICGADKVRREEKFTVRLSDLEADGALTALYEQYRDTEGMLIGIMDLVFEENGNTILLDYKTDHVKSESELLERYTEQIRLYASALRLLDGHAPSECWIYSFALKKAIPVKLI